MLFIVLIKVQEDRMLDSACECIGIITPLYFKCPVHCLQLSSIQTGIPGLADIDERRYRFWRCLSNMLYNNL